MCIGYVTASSEEAAADDDRSALPDPYDHMARLNEYERAIHLTETEQPANVHQARKLLEGLVRDFPASYQFHASLGSVMGRLDKHAEALESFRNAEKIHPDSADLWMNIAIACYSTGDDQTAKNYLLRVIEQEGSPAQASMILAQLYADQGDILGAKGVLRRLLERRDITDLERRQALEALQ